MNAPRIGLRVAFVVPRYGPNIRGGAETATRLLAQKLVQLDDTTVDVLTTTAKDINTWANHYPVGKEINEGVVIWRYEVDRPRAQNFDQATARMLSASRSQSLSEAKHFTELQGPVSASLIDAISKSEYDVVVFYPYLYHCTTEGLLNCPSATVLHPAAHAEMAIDLPIYDRVFESVDALVYQTAAERKVVEDRFNVAQKPAINLGMGFDSQVVSSGAVRNRIGVDDAPYLICLGRVDVPKGTSLLAELFGEYKLRNPSNLKLVIAGPVSVLPPSRPDVIVTGEVDDADKERLLDGAQIVISPSLHESFSILLLEAWNKKKAVLVNAACEATVEQVKASGGGLYFGDYETFEASLNRLLGDPELLRVLGLNGWRYMHSRYEWPNLITRYRNFLVSVVERKRGNSP